MNAKTISVKSPAKLNLTFDILGTLPGGFHEVTTLMQAIDLSDELTFEIRPASQVSIVFKTEGCPAEFPCDDSNLIARAARVFSEHVHPFQLTVSINKQIPIAAGMAGGSSNAAATLLALDEYFGNSLTRQQLTRMAQTLGSDVPFCLTGGTAIGRGRGDLLTGVKSDLLLDFLIVKPKDIALATPWVYGAYDQYVEKNGPDSIKHPELENAVGALAFGDLSAAIAAFGNVFEPVVFSHFPELASLKDNLLSFGCPYVQLTGSGPTIFCIVTDLEKAHFIRSKCISKFGAEKLMIYLGRSINNGCAVAAVN